MIERDICPATKIKVHGLYSPTLGEKCLVIHAAFFSTSQDNVQF